MVGAAEERLCRDVGCPFCGLACDDLAVANAGGSLRVVEAGCWLSRERYRNSEIDPTALIDGRPADRPAALARAAEILSGSRAPVFAVAADIAATRVALRLADRLGGVLDHPDSAALLRNIRTIQDVGSLATTLSEIRNRADVVLVIGPDPLQRLPRFVERCIDVERTLSGLDPRQRSLFRLGPPAAGGPASGGGNAVTELTCGMEHLPAAIALLGAALRGRRLKSEIVEGITAEGLTDLADRLLSARYGVIAWVPGAFDSPDGEVIGQAILELAREATRSTRCSVVALGGSGNSLGVNQVCTWQSGVPVPAGFGRGVPEHDPYRFSARRMLRDGETDALVWIDAFGGSAPPDEGEAPTIVLAPRVPDAARPAVFLPVGMPGLDHAGTVFRTDNVVALRLPALRDARAPDAATTLGEIERLLAGEGRR